MAKKNGIVNSATYRPVLVGKPTRNTKFLEERRQRKEKEGDSLDFFSSGLTGLGY